MPMIAQDRLSGIYLRETMGMQMDALPRRRVGKTKLEVTQIGLGGAPIGGFRATIADSDAVRLIDDGYEAGIRYFDTSPFNGYGRSELRMGAALRDKPRDSYELSTKIGRILHVRKPGEALPRDFRENGLPGFVPEYDYSYDTSCARWSIRTCGWASTASTSR